MKFMIFHHPLPLADNPKSGSQVRPIKMLEAFQQMGYEVDLVVGYSSQRKRAINEIKAKIKAGKKYEFMYCENSTMPTQLTDPHHLPLHPFLDFNFFDFLKKHSIPIGLFYRDIYWTFDVYDKQVVWFKRIISKFFYRYELQVYNKLLSKMYFPSIQMKTYLPYIHDDFVDALPPGHSFIESKSLGQYVMKLEETNINLLYVGGLSNHYKLDVFVNTIKDFPNFKLTICTREQEWENEKHKYEPLSENIVVVHKNGKDLTSLYIENDIAILYVEPQKYWEFAVPIKLFEYIGQHKPILASKGTLAAKFVEEYNIGWTIPYETLALKNFLNVIKKQDILNYMVHIEECANKHTWQARAAKVIKDLTS